MFLDKIEQVESSRPGGARIASGSRKIHALILDRSAADRSAIGEMLISWDVRAEQAASYEQAVRMVADAARTLEPINLMFIESQMPATNDWDAIRDSIKTVPVIMLSSGDRARAAIPDRESRTSGSVVKPVNRWDLLCAIYRVIGPDTHAMPGPLAPHVRVLLVNDSEEDQGLLKACVKATPYEVNIVGYGADACGRFQAGGYDLVLIDIRPPWTDALTTIREIRGWERLNGRSPVPIVALTTGLQDEIAGVEAGCTAHLAKPLTEQALLSALNRYQDRHTKPEVLKTAAAKVPAALQSLVPRYLSGRHKDIEALWSALDREDFAVIARVGHNLKGTGSPYGFPEITEIGRSLERAGKENDKTEAARHVAHLENYLTVVEN